MLESLVALVALALTPATSHRAQDHGSSVLAQAAAAYQEKRYGESLSLYRKAIEAGEAKDSVYYDAACSAALAGDAAGSLDLLELAIRHGFANADHMTSDLDLSSLHGSPRWAPTVESARKTFYGMLPKGVALERQAALAVTEKRYRDAGDLYLQASNYTGIWPHNAYRAAVYYTAAGDFDKAFSCLDRTVVQFPYFYQFENIKYLQKLHHDPRWLGIVDRIRKARERDLTPSDKIYGLSRFWQEAKAHFAYFDRVPDLDWDKAYREFIPVVLATHGRYEYARALMRFCALLKDGHTNVWLPSDLDAEGLLPLQFSTIRQKIYVTNARTDLVSQAPIGSEVLSIDGIPTQTYMTERMFPYLMSSTDYIRWDAAAWTLSSGPRGKTIRLALRRPDGSQSQQTYRFAMDDKPIEFSVKSPSRAPVEYRDLGDGLAYVAINTFEGSKVVPDFEALLPKLAACKGLVIDVRRNGGGSGSNSMAVASHLTDRPLRTSIWRTRESRSSYVAWGRFAADGNGDTDYIPSFTGNAWYSNPGDTIQPSSGIRLLMPIVVLSDHPTGSAAEDFLVDLDQDPNVTRVGRRSYGSTGQPLEFYLVGNIYARVCTKRDTFPDGRDFVGVGVIPQVEIEPTIEDVTSGRDVILGKGIDVLKVKIAAGERAFLAPATNPCAH